MSYYLTMETATDLGSVAVGESGSVAAEALVANRRHAAAVMPAVEEVLGLAGIAYGDLAGIVVADGPGSFTGLRIGFATAKGILREHDHLTLATAPSLLAAAWSAQAFVDGPVAALYDALRGEVFAAVYTFGGAGVEVAIDPTLTTVADLVGECSVTPTIAVGDGALLYADQIREWTNRAPVGPPAGAPRASALLELLRFAGAVTRVEDPGGFEPEYGRPAAAQVRWEREHGTSLPGSDRSSR